MKIVDVAEYYAPLGGGVKTYINQKLIHAARLGHEMIIIAPSEEDKIESKHGGKVIWQKNPRLIFDKRYGVFKNEKAVHDVLDAEAPDIVEGSSIWSAGRVASNWDGDALKLLIFHQDAIAAYGHTFLDSYISRSSIDWGLGLMWKGIRKLSRRYDHTIVSGDWLADRLRSFKIKDPVAVPFGIDKSRFAPSKKNEEVKAKIVASCGMPIGTPLLIVASRFHPEKRLKTLFKAVRIVNKNTPVSMIVYGDGILSKSHRQYAANTKGVRLAGFTKDREELAVAYASADLMVHGSAAETFGLGVAEGLCSGLPVIAPSVGGAADLVGDKYGILYPPGNAQKCAEAIVEALDYGSAYWKRKLKSVNNDINSVEQHFDLLFEKYEQLLEFKKRSIQSDTDVFKFSETTSSSASFI